jgi:hypothetical protein
MASDSPFGRATRVKALRAYMGEATYARSLTAEAAWEHVYRLLLSVDRRTQLAHVYDSNHMQKGGVWHKRAIKFTEALCKRLGVKRADLGEQIDFMFKRCVEEFLEQREEEAEDPGATDAEEAVTDFALEVREILIAELGAAAGVGLDAAIMAIEQSAERHFEIEKKRQNVRGEGFEDTLEYLFIQIANIPPEQIKVRCRASDLPGFKSDPPTPKGKKKPKIPKPDIALLSSDGKLTRWIVTAKWSLRQDRLDQFGQEAEYYKDNRLQEPRFEFVFVTNEMDIARLRDVLHPDPGAGGFYFHRVYHLNLELLEETHGDAFKQLAVYRDEGRLLCLADLIEHAKKHFGVAPVMTTLKAAQPTTRAPRKR